MLDLCFLDYTHYFVSDSHLYMNRFVAILTAENVEQEQACRFALLPEVKYVKLPSYTTDISAPRTFVM